MSDRQRNLFILLLVAGLLAASGFAIASQKTRLGLDLQGGVELVYQGQPTPQTPTVNQDALQRAVDIMRQRVDQLGVSEPEIQRAGANDIYVGLPAVKDFARAEKQVGTTAQLAFYDWEANAILPTGKTVASQLQAQNPTALQISQGSGAAPGEPGGGSMALYDAVKLAASQPVAAPSKSQTRKGPQYYAFGAPGSAACATAAAQAKKTPAPGLHCLLSGPDDNQTDLTSGLPSGVSLTQPGVQVLAVPVGTVVLQAADPKSSHTTSFSDPTAQFYVLNDHASLLGSDISNPKQGTDQAGSPDVEFGFSGKGGQEFQTVTRAIAQRGQLVSGLGQKLNQHFAVALDNKLVTVPQIDYTQYPDGISGDQGADITGGFSRPRTSRTCCVSERCRSSSA
jgi:SecD/SecF fusion protein